MSETLFAGRAPRLWLRLEQHSDKPFYARVPPEMVDGFVINANLIESSPEACGAFLKELGKPFVVDPMSYRFDRTSWYIRSKNGEEVGKRNYSRLWGAYAEGVGSLKGDPLDDRGSARVPSGPDLARFCRNTIEFQELRMAREWAIDGVQYSMAETFFGPELAPVAYLAPYVVIGEADSRTEASRAALLAATTVDVARPRPVIAVLPIQERALADFELMRSLSAEIVASGVQGALLWTVGLSALRLAETPELFTGLLILIRNLRDAGVEVGMLYGGILSALLRGFGMSGFSHALLYGETRGLDSSGGRARAAFYVPPLRDFVPYGLGRSLVSGMRPDDYRAIVCNCRVCDAVLSDGAGGLAQYFETWLPAGATRPLPTASATDLNRLHFLYARSAELELARAQSESDLIASLASAADRYPPRVTQTIRAWAARLRAA